jgi:hypothetical protein
MSPVVPDILTHVPVARFVVEPTVQVTVPSKFTQLVMGIEFAPSDALPVEVEPMAPAAV